MLEPDAMIDSNHAKQDSLLCMVCGFCCDGTIFANAPVCAADNLRSLEALAAKFFVRRAKTRFEQPCPAYAEHGCRIYTDRPETCREFSCKLLDAYREQTISMHEAQKNQVLSLGKNLRDTLQHIDPSLSGIALPKLWRQWDSSSNGADGLAFRQKHGTALMQMAALRWYLWEHFYGEKKPDLPSWNG